MKPNFVIAFVLASLAAADADDEVVLKYGDGTAEGRKSLGGSGEMIQFASPGEGGALSGIRIHASRYGTDAPPDEQFLIYVLSADRSEVLHTELAPYALIEKGEAKWIDIEFARPRSVPETFWIALDFRAHRTKGAYVSYDTSTGGAHSNVGLPGIPAKDVDFGGDWMVQAVLGQN